MLHLDNQKKVWLQQEKHFDEIWILLRHLYEKKNASMLSEMEREVEEYIKANPQEYDEEVEERAEKIVNDFANPLDDVLEN
jgi:chromatin segregation and condensation protein Rec8/ScpA/Scc1 (kleisin family)